MDVNPAVIIKSYPHGIALHLDKEASFEEILEQLEDKMKESAHFFQGSRLALSIEDRKVNPMEERQLLRILTVHGGLNIICVAEKAQSEDGLYVRALQKMEPHVPEEPFIIHRGSLTDGDVLENHKSSIIVIGDVEEDCRVISAKNIIVIGGLYGEAYAGTDAKENHYVAALSIQTDRIQIAGCKIEREKPAKGKWFSRAQKSPQIALVQNHEVITETLTKELLNDSGIELF